MLEEDKPNLELIKKLEDIATKVILDNTKTHVLFSEIKSNIITELSSYIYDVTGRKPIITPVMIDIKKD